MAGLGPMNIVCLNLDKTTVFSHQISSGLSMTLLLEVPKTLVSESEGYEAG